MDGTPFPVIDLVATGSNIQRLRQERGLTVRDLQRYFGFEEPRAIYKWQKGETLPSVDNLYALGILLEVPMDGILVPIKRHSEQEQQASCCSQFIQRAWYQAMIGSFIKLMLSMRLLILYAKQDMY